MSNEMVDMLLELLTKLIDERNELHMERDTLLHRIEELQDQFSVLLSRQRG